MSDPLIITGTISAPRWSCQDCGVKFDFAPAHVDPLNLPAPPEVPVVTPAVLPLIIRCPRCGTVKFNGPAPVSSV